MSNLHLTTDMKKIILAIIFSEREQARLVSAKEKERLPLLVTEWEEFARDAIKIIHAFADSTKERNQKSELQNLRQERGDPLMVISTSQTRRPLVKELNTATPEATEVVPTIVSDTEEHFISSEEKDMQRKKRNARVISKREHRDREMKVEEIQNPSFDIATRNHKKQRTEQEQDAAQLLLSLSHSFRSVHFPKS